MAQIMISYVVFSVGSTGWFLLVFQMSQLVFFQIFNRFPAYRTIKSFAIALSQFVPFKAARYFEFFVADITFEVPLVTVGC
jgi:hypothetical protein